MNNKERILHIGLDAHDSPIGGCTTHFSYLLTRKLLSRNNVEFIDYPNLIRLNPVIPWRTRGNGAVVIRIKFTGDLDDLIDEIKSMSMEYVSEVSKEVKGKKPGIVLYTGIVNDLLRWIYRRALTDVVDLDVALRICEKVKAKIIGGVSQGVIGALAAIGGLGPGEDYTFELIAYRSPEYWGLRDRLVDYESVEVMDKNTKPYTFNNIDYEVGKVLITPRGPDPVLFGIRGEDPRILVNALNYVKVHEPISGWMIFRTNQGTDAHIVHRFIGLLRPYQTGRIHGIISSKPKSIRGGHVEFTIRDSTGKVKAYVYEPTGKFRDIALKLIEGDEVILYGVTRPGLTPGTLTFSVEKIEVIKLSPLIIIKNPKCPKCGKTMKSMGKDKGFKCPKCKFKDPNAKKVKIIAKRNDIKPGLYVVPPRAMRHLTKPLCRYGMEKKAFHGILKNTPWIN